MPFLYHPPSDSAFDKAVKHLDLIGPDRFVDGFEHHRDVIKATIVHDEAEKVEAEVALGQTMVTIDPAAELCFGTIQVHAAQVFEANNPVELRKGPFTVSSGSQVVAGDKGVTGVEADANAGFVIDQFDDAGQMLEAMAHIGTLSGSVFDDSSNSCGLRKRQIERFGDSLQTIIFINLFEVAAGMKVEKLQPQQFTAMHLVEKGGA